MRFFCNFRYLFSRRSHPFIIFFYTTTFIIAFSTVVVIWKYKNDCYSYFNPTSIQENILNCQLQLQTRDFKTDMYPKSINHKDMVVNSLQDFSTHNKQNFKDTKEINTSSIRTNVSQYFEERRKLSEDACHNLIVDEESVQLEPEDQENMLKELIKLERLEKGEKFMQTASGKRTRWILYKHSDPKNNVEIQWCPIYKSASTPWMAIFTKLAKALTPITEAKIRKGKITFVNLARDFRLSIPKTQIKIEKTSSSSRYLMVVVRHPFKRLLSAYRDKIEKVKGREYYHKTYSKKIVARFRKSSSVDNLNQRMKNGGAKIPLWFQMAMDLQQNFHGKFQDSSLTIANANTDITTKEIQKMSKSTTHSSVDISISSTSRPAWSEMIRNFNIPTFEEFCQYLLTVDPRNMDEHWRPMTMDCSPCHNKFDLILKVEGLERDREEIFKLLGYDNPTSEYRKELNNVWNNWTNPSSKTSGHNETFYFSQLSDSVIQGLYNIYKLDFQLYGYSPDEYFEMANQVSFEE